MPSEDAAPPPHESSPAEVRVKSHRFLGVGWAALLMIGGGVIAALVAALSGRSNYGAAGFLVATNLAGTLLGLAAWDLFVGLLATRFAPYLALPEHITLGLPRGIVPDMALNLAPRQGWAWLNDPATRKWTSITTVVAAAVTLSFVLVWTWTEAVHPSAAKCSNAPARVNKIPQLIDILACIVAFILGRITARPKIQSRRQLKDWTTGRANTHQLGQSRARAQSSLPQP